MVYLFPNYIGKHSVKKKKNEAKQPLQTYMKYFQIHYLHGLNRWDCDPVAQRAIIYNQLCSRTYKLIPKLLGLAVGKSVKFCKIFTSAKVAICRFCMESAFPKPLLRKLWSFIPQELETLVSASGYILA